MSIMDAVGTLHICSVCGQAGNCAVVCQDCRHEVRAAIRKSYEETNWSWGGLHKQGRGLGIIYSVAAAVPGVIVHLPSTVQLSMFLIYLMVLMVVALVIGVYFWSS